MSGELTVAQARELLARYSCLETEPADPGSERSQLREALLLLVDLAEFETLGVCANSPAQGFSALAQYLQAMGYELPFDPQAAAEGDGPAFIKLNTRQMRYYWEPYSGPARGVLVTCQSPDDAVAGTYGHLPLDLFAAHD